MSACECRTGGVIHFGVVLLPGYQLLDAAAPVDYINNHSKARLTDFGVPADIIARAPEIHWHYIGESLDEVHPSSGPAELPTHTYKNPPSHLDYLIVPGALPDTPLTPDCTHFLKTCVPKLRALLTVCTGSLCIAPTGVLDGHRVCSNKSALRKLALAHKLRKEVTWMGDRRWVVDRKWIVDRTIWSAAGITAGLDLGAEFARVHFDPEIVGLVKAISEETPRPDIPDVWAKLLDGVKLNC